ncbi:hypothetical protein ACJVDH_04560 [Pedobacter sp. AW1-32]|uniref:hypothetical protein n=1 Tax=Pedobacter sp. AW1-32 TaxID=3383026 RepID=UPI003FEF1A20
MKKQKLLWQRLFLLVFAATLLSACKKNEASPQVAGGPSPSDLENGKEAFGMVVKDSSILLNASSLALLTKVDSNELIFSSKPDQADSMSTNFIITSSIIEDKAPQGLLLYSLGTFEDAQGYHVTVRKADLGEYILYANVSGKIDLQPQASSVAVQSGEKTLSFPKTTMVNAGNTISGFDIALNQNLPFIGVGNTGAYLGLDLLATPSFTYNISIRWGQVSVSLGGGVELKRLKTTLYTSVGLPTFTLGGDAIPIPFAVIPIGPILITPYVSVLPYISGSAKGEAVFSLTSTGNFQANVSKALFSNFSASANGNFSVQAPVVERLAAPVKIDAGVQFTIGIGAYGKVIYSQVQAKIGPNATFTPNFLNKTIEYDYGVDANITASAGASALGFSIFNFQQVLLNKEFFSNSGSVPMPIIG